MTLGSSVGTIRVNAEPAAVFKEITSLGGNRGWLYGNRLWQLRGLLGRMIGGIGLRRERRQKTILNVGDSLDFWRVEELQMNESLLLKAEMKAPGKAWLQFDIVPLQSDQLILYHIAFLPPRIARVSLLVSGIPNP